MSESPQSEQGSKGIKESLWDPIAGFGVTFRTMFKKVVTEQYPFEKLPTAPRFHGRHQLNRWPDGLEKCIGCELCAWACPADAIYVEGASNTQDERFSPGEVLAEVEAPVRALLQGERTALNYVQRLCSTATISLA